MPRTLFGGRIRTSTVIMAVVFAALLALYLLLPEPASVAQRNNRTAVVPVVPLAPSSTPTRSPSPTPSRSPTPSPVETGATPQPSASRSAAPVPTRPAPSRSPTSEASPAAVPTPAQPNRATGVPTPAP